MPRSRRPGCSVGIETASKRTRLVLLHISAKSVSENCFPTSQIFRRGQTEQSNRTHRYRRHLCHFCLRIRSVMGYPRPRSPRLKRSQVSLSCSCFAFDGKYFFLVVHNVNVIRKHQIYEPYPFILRGSSVLSGLLCVRLLIGKMGSFPVHVLFQYHGLCNF